MSKADKVQLALAITLTIFLVIAEIVLGPFHINIF